MVSLDPALVLQGTALAGQAFRLVLEAIWRERDHQDRRNRCDNRSCRDGSAPRRTDCQGRFDRHGHGAGGGWPLGGNCPGEALGYRRPGCPDATPARRHAGQQCITRHERRCRGPRRLSRHGRHRRSR